MSKKKTDLVPRRKGRPPVIMLKPGLKKELIELIRAGAYASTACLALGLGEDFYWNMQAKAERGDPLYRSIMTELKKAEAEAEIDLSNRMLLGGNHFLPSATFLERRFRDRWGRSDRRTVDANVNITIASVNYNQLLKQINRKAIDDKD